MLNKLTKKRLHGSQKWKVKNYVPIPPFDCMYGCIARCNPEMPLEDSCYCSGQVCTLI